MLILVSHIKGRTQTEGNKNRVLSKIFGSKMEEVTEDRRKLYNEESDFSSSPNIIGLIKSKKMRQACTKETRYPYRVLMGNLKEIDHLEDLDIDRGYQNGS